MSRIRTIKPEFWTNEKVVECSTNARLLFVGIWNFCDDDGNHPSSEKTVKGSVFPCDNFTTDDIRGFLNELEANGLIELYVNEKKEFLNVLGWNHQKIDRKQKPRYPSKFDDHSTIIRRTENEESTTVRCSINISQTTITDKKERKSALARAKKNERTPLEILKSSLTEKTAQDVIDHRKALRKPLTARAAQGLADAFNAFGDPERAAEAMIVNGWQGFKPEWLNGNSHTKPKGRSNGVEGYLRMVQQDMENGDVTNQPNEIEPSPSSPGGHVPVLQPRGQRS